ncbi:TetR family transcriptional regulator [Amycolatopsis mediterranei S699]|uniref:TetR family transcriptional regulator n=3 Tax=Amycolatopsis mediterranei TaxID=33910 RepID=A0A0H3DEW5_AMYMU|nr:TetR family transcriptional regulator [Amycolatopsis mediterranei U32]AEK46437.1 TetR family transcriptional regulator [Amycolatopsis mediterranei S699]AGT88301.1 TetR family transcriptional regulator [Amycolatopsis mediterranei RB]KDO12721.1 TetR family transcriptional regulator [Amycolatopsis mediterranei]AFO81173.1 TetR family transcriptional regulator [Amycolatopsis mediterranei S699]
MAMVGKREWLDAGLVLLAEQGAPSVTIERLTERLGLSKGSFYHHFKGMSGYRTALLAHFETERTTRFVEQAEAAEGDRLRALLRLVLAPGPGPELEIAVRAWALQDAEARAVQERVDSTRVAYLTEISGDAGLAQALYLVVVGAGQVVPPLTGRQLKNALELVLGRRK